MDSTLLLILFLIKNPTISSIEELLKKLQEEFEDECLWSINDLGIELNALTEAEILDKKDGNVTAKGLKFLAESKTLSYITENHLNPGEITKKAILLFLSKDLGKTNESIRREIDAFFGKSLLGLLLKFQNIENETGFSHKRLKPDLICLNNSSFITTGSPIKKCK